MNITTGIALAALITTACGRNEEKVTSKPAPAPPHAVPADASPGPGASEPPILEGRYNEDTVILAYSMLEYIHRLDKLQTPGAAELRAFLDRHIGKSMASSIAILSIAFTAGHERARFKMANDYSAGMSQVEGWSADDIRAIAALCNQIIVRNGELEKELATVASNDDVAASWKVVKAATDDPLVPTEDAAKLASAFLVAVRTNNPKLVGVSADLRREIIEFRQDFRETDLPVARPPRPVAPPVLKKQDLERFKKHFEKLPKGP